MCDDFDNELHLIPAGEVMPHIATLQCWCKPVQDKDEPTVYTHNRHEHSN
jgi:hypothetical protein